MKNTTTYQIFDGNNPYNGEIYRYPWHFTSVEQYVRAAAGGAEQQGIYSRARRLYEVQVDAALYSFRSAWIMQLICRCDTVPSCVNHARFHTVLPCKKHFQ